MMILILYFVGWLVGICLGSFLVIQPLIILFFSIPYSIKLKKVGALGINTNVIFKDIVSLVVQLILFFIAFYFIKKSHNLLVGFYVGVAIITLLGISKIFKNANNIADYIERNFKFIHPKFIKQYIDHVTNDIPESTFKTKHMSELLKLIEK